MKLDIEQIENWRKARWRARTDLLYLCNSILGFRDVNSIVHGPLINSLQKFPLPDDPARWDVMNGGAWAYKPPQNIYSLTGPRRTLILDARGHLKTTINATAHVIQWILNYPDITMVIFQASLEKAESILYGIKYHFQHNETFRQLFPEHCPQKKPHDWGTKSYFVTEARSKACYTREPTVLTAALEKGAAGYHFDVMKFSDIVDEQNSQTMDQIVKVRQSFQMSQNLLVKPDGWMDVEGTRYSFADVYGKIIEEEERNRKTNKPLKWNIYVRGCFKKNTPGPPAFAPHEQELDDLKDAEGREIPWWPERWPWEELDRMRRENPFLFSCQQRNFPVAGEECVFPVNQDYPKKISRESFRKIPMAFHSVTVDTAETQGIKSKFTAISTVGWSKAGKAYVHDIRHGRMLPDDILWHIFDLQVKFRPMTIKIEETPFVRGLMPSINRVMETGVLKYRNTQINMAGVIPNIELIKRDNDVSKIERITNTLQPWYMSGEIIFLDDLTCFEHLLQELSKFPHYEFNDILDTLADHFQGREYFGRLVAKANTEEQKEHVVEQVWKKVQAYEMERFLQVAPEQSEPGYRMPYPALSPYSRTGGL